MTTLITDPQTIEFAKQMNAEIDVYFPADEQDPATLKLYDELFSLLRQLYFLYQSISLEEINTIFVNFYNSLLSDKYGMVNTLQNRVDQLVGYYLSIQDDYQEIVEDKAVELYLNAGDRRAKAAILYFHEKGYFPEMGEDVTEYFQAVDAIETEVNSYVDEIEDSQSPKQSVPGVEVEPIELDQSPEAVVSRYLKGSGVYDPALRNSGFRVDKDIQR